MFDIKAIREAPEAFDTGLKRRGMEPMAALLLELDEKHRAAITEQQTLQQHRNEASKKIGQLKKAGVDATEAMADVARMKDRLDALGEEADEFASRLNVILQELPNLPLDDVPDGPDESANVEVRRVGEPRRENDLKDHIALGEGLGLMDFPTAAKLSGARFVMLRGQLARLERALAQFMLDLHVSEFGYEEIAPPLMVREPALFGTGQLPKFAEDLFRTTGDHWLIPTAEVPLTNIVADEILDEAELPLRYTAWTPCFRSEAGAAGRDTRGMIRQHQFAKVEMVSVTTPEQSLEELERMTKAAETVLERLELPYRVMALSTGDMGFAAQKTYDLEVWLPGQNAYREISSCSVCGDFQARRMKARYRPEGERHPRPVHTLNGSGVAVGRALVAVIENHQRRDGAIAIPEVLHPYMAGATVLEPKDGGQSSSQ